MIYNHRHRIAIHDQKMMEFVRSNLKMSDVVSIRGVMVYKMVEVARRKVTRGWILAKSIHKIENPEEIVIEKPKPKRSQFQKKFFVPDLSKLR